MMRQIWSRDQILVTSLLACSLFLAGLSAATIAPYRAVVAVKELGFSNGAYAAIITLSSVATAIASVVLGALSDRMGDRRKLVILSAVMGGVAFALLFLVPGRLTYLVAFCVILPFGGALFSQILNALIYAAYLLAMTRAASPYQVLWLQGPNAVATAALVSLTITYVQDSIKGQVGLSTSLLDVLTVAATLLTAVLFRAFSTNHSYLNGFLAAGGASLIGAGLLALAGRMEQ